MKKLPIENAVIQAVMEKIMDQNGKLCRFGDLVKGTLEERRKPSEQRCAYACRCSEASRPRWAA